MDHNLITNMRSNHHGCRAHRQDAINIFSRNRNSIPTIQEYEIQKAREASVTPPASR